MFLHLSVILFTGGGGVLQTPPRWTPHPQDTATAADGTHPTGMHSVTKMLSVSFIERGPFMIAKRCHSPIYGGTFREISLFSTTLVEPNLYATFFRKYHGLTPP